MVTLIGMDPNPLRGVLSNPLMRLESSSGRVMKCHDPFCPFQSHIFDLKVKVGSMRNQVLHRWQSFNSCLSSIPNPMTKKRRLSNLNKVL